MIVTLFPLTSLSKETTNHQRWEDVPGHRRGASRRFSSTQFLFGRHYCAHQTLRRAFVEQYPDPADGFIPAKQGRRGQTWGPCPMVGQVER